MNGVEMPFQLNASKKEKVVKNGALVRFYYNHRIVPVIFQEIGSDMQMTMR